MNDTVTTEFLNSNLDKHIVDLVHLSVCPKATLLFSVYDAQLREFGPPVAAPSARLVVASAMGTLREFPNCPYGIRPADFTLYYVGAYSPSTGQLFDIPPAGQPVIIGDMKRLIEICEPNDIKSVLESVDRLYNTIMKPETTQ